jgi:hypothetical protein
MSERACLGGFFKGQSLHDNCHSHTRLPALRPCWCPRRRISAAAQNANRLTGIRSGAAGSSKRNRPMTAKPKHRRARGSGPVYRLGCIWWIADPHPDGKGMPSPRSI